MDLPSNVMSKVLIACCGLIALASCSDDNGDDDAWINSMVENVSALDQETVDGTTVYVDRAEQMVYVEDCAVAREATAESGWAYICDD